ncbi:hypothetical protein ASD10_04445 [Aeromicrobium sp. Root472D3]|nr:hypothetical protein ASD10_04445 [Aeromicrobium sp. Root472D3]
MSGASGAVVVMVFLGVLRGRTLSHQSHPRSREELYDDRVYLRVESVSHHMTVVSKRHLF